MHENPIDEEPGRKYITTTMLAKLGDASIPTMNRLIQDGRVKPAKITKEGVPLFDPEAPDIIAWLRAVRW
ncbi:MAG TPA: hypothetical protein VG815_18820 [Chloroflexota bacterium]|nr:hypothetical protein [Chloroflexota bacterium]